jgi:hypothetical protein
MLLNKIMSKNKNNYIELLDIYSKVLRKYADMYINRLNKIITNNIIFINH